MDSLDWAYIFEAVNGISDDCEDFQNQLLALKEKGGDEAVKKRLSEIGLSDLDSDGFLAAKSNADRLLFLVESIGRRRGQG